MTAKRLISAFVLLMYAGVPETLVFDVVLATIPMVLLVAFTWRVVWPRWMLVRVSPALDFLLRLVPDIDLDVSPSSLLEAGDG